MKPLKEGETICLECRGEGHFQDDHNNIQTCKKCKGYGKLDWIEMIVGKNSGSYIFWINVKPVKPIETITVNFTIERKRNGTSKRRRSNLSKM